MGFFAKVSVASVETAFEGGRLAPNQAAVKMIGHVSDAKLVGSWLGNPVLVSPHPTDSTLKQSPAIALLQLARVCDAWSVPAPDVISAQIRPGADGLFEMCLHVMPDRLRIMVDDSEGHLKPQIVDISGRGEYASVTVEVNVGGVRMAALFSYDDPWIRAAGLIPDPVDPVMSEPSSVEPTP